jgi:hypothetical protein
MKSIAQWIDYARAHGYPFAEKMQQEYQLHLHRENRTQDSSLFSCLSSAMFWAFPWPLSQSPNYWAEMYTAVLQKEEAAERNERISASLN